MKNYEFKQMTDSSDKERGWGNCDPGCDPGPGGCSPSCDPNYDACDPCSPYCPPGNDGCDPVCDPYCHPRCSPWHGYYRDLEVMRRKVKGKKVKD